MPAAQRITNGHRAAICGLMLAGVPYGVSCKIAGLSVKTMRGHMPDGWVRGRLPVRVVDMTPAQFKVYRKLQPIVGGQAAGAEAVAA